MQNGKRIDLRLLDKTVLITGGTGTLGRQLVSRLLKTDIKKVIVFSRDELKQAEMEHDVSDKRCRFIIGDVRNLKTLNRAFNGVDIVVHAAALKRIEKCEYSPFEAIQTNVLGAQNVIDAAIDNGIDRVVAISTDKSVNPISLYGATKLCSDKLFVAADAYAAGKTLFSVIRFGNFINSRGSVFKLWKKQLKNGGSISLTDREMTRFFIAPDEAVSRIFDVLSIMRGGEIYCPKMPSAKMIEIAQALSSDIEIIGMRDGEKVHEELIIPEDADRTFEIDGFYITSKIYRGMGQKVPVNFSYASNMNWDWINPEAII